MRKTGSAFLCPRRLSRPAAFVCGAALVCALLCLAAVFRPQAAAAQRFSGGETRSLKIYFVHTQEKEEVVFKKNGRYVRSGLQRLNYLLRDWRRNEATHMDPRLFDLVWQIYRLSGSQDYLHVVSAYRSPQTNAMLRLSSPASGVAKHSRHMEGKAMDFYLPDVNLAYLRAIALKLQGGGIGYYPASGSPFVHVDVGAVRHWPRMSAAALAALFPDGRSMHIPANGRLPAQYSQAVADYNSRHAAPLPILSAQALFGGASARQVILAAADGRLPRFTAAESGNRLPVAPRAPFAAPQPPLLALAPLPVPENVPIPIFSPHWTAEQEEADDAADSAAASVPVPQFKPEDKPDEIGALLAYAPLPAADKSAAALQALSALVPVPAGKPVAQAAFAPAEDKAAPVRAVPLPTAKQVNVTVKTAAKQHGLVPQQVVMQSAALP